MLLGQKVVVSAVGAVPDAAGALVDEGVLRFNAGRHDEALGCFTRALRAGPPSAGVLLFRALAYKALGRPRRALADVAAATRLEPRSAALRLRAAALLREAGLPAAALTEAREAARLEPSTPAFELRAELELAAGRPGLACRSLARAVAGAPRCAQTSLRAAGLLASAGRGADAAIHYARAARLSPALETLLPLADAQSGLGLVTEAASTLRKAAALAPRSAVPRLKLSGLLVRLGRDKEAMAQCARAAALAPGSAEAAEHLAELALRLRGAAAARPLLERAIFLNPRDGGLRLKAADALSRLGRHGEAEAQGDAALRLEASPEAFRAKAERLRRRGLSSAGVWRRAVRALPSELEPRLALTEALARAGRVAEAARAGAEAVRLFPGAWQVHRDAARLESAAGRPAAAARAFERARALAPRSGELRLESLRPLVELGRLDEARALCVEAAGLGPDPWPALRAKADLELDLCETEQALGTLRQAVRPRSAPARLLIDASHRFEMAASYDEALAALKRAAAQDSAPALAAAARLCTWQGDRRRAEAFARRAAAIEGGRAAGLRALGICSALAGKRAPAARFLGAALRLAPEDLEALVWLGETRRRQGRLKAAWDILERARRLSPFSLGCLINRELILLARKRPALMKEEGYILSRVPKQIAGLRQALSARGGLVAGLEKALRAMKGNRSETATFTWKGRLVRHIHYFPRDLPVALQASVRFGDPARVLRHFDRLLQRQPKEAYLYSHRGEVCLWSGRYDEALRDFKNAKRLNPALLWPTVGSAAAHMMQGRFDQALSLLDFAAQHGGSDSILSTWRGEIRRKTGQPDRCLAELKKIPESFPFRPGVWLNAALAHGALGDFAARRRSWARLERHLPEFCADARTEAGLPSGALAEPQVEAVLEKALAMMKGNRSSWMYSYVLADGRLKVARLRGVSKELLPPVLPGNAWAFSS